jgi:hypothetical protein
MVARIHDAAITLIEAPAGYGKSVLLDAFAARVDATWIERPEELEEIDGCRWWLLDLSTGIADACIVARMERLARRRSPARLVVAGRWFGNRARALALRAGNLLLGPEQLAVPAGELDHDPDGSLSAVTGGWPLLIDVVTTRRVGADAAEIDLVALRAVTRSLLGPVLAGLSADERHLAGLVGALPVIDEGLLRAAGGDRTALDCLIDAGVPLARQADGAYHLPPIVRIVLAEDSPARLTGDRIRGLAAELVNRGFGVAAVRLAHRWGGVEEGAATLASLPSDAIDGFEPDDLLGLLDLVNSAIARFPRLRLWAALAERGRANLDRQRCHLEAAAASVGGDDVEAVRAEARAELLHLDALTGDHSSRLADAIASETRRVGASCERCRLLLVEAEAMRLASGGTPDELEEAALQLSRAARGWSHLGQANRSIGSLRALVVQALTPLGRYREADAAMVEAHRLTVDRPRFTTLNLIVRNRNAALAGWLGLEDQLHRGLELSTGPGNDWLLAYSYWSLMLYAANDRKAVEVCSYHDLAWSALGRLREHPTGAVFLAESAAALARCGQVERAGELVGDLVHRRAQCAVEYDLASVVVDARRLSPEEVIRRVEKFLASGTVPTARRWRVLLEVAWAWHHHRGVCPAPLQAQILAEADLNGVGDVPARLLPEVFAPEVGAVPPAPPVFVSIAPDPGGRTEPSASTVSAPGSGGRAEPSEECLEAEQVSLTALGRFAIEVGGEERPVASAKARELLKLLVALGGSASVDVVVDALWPDADGEVGRRRLKNVVSRARAEAGPIVVRDRDRVALRAAVSTDVRRFDLAARHALLLTRSDLEVVRDACLAALALYGGDLLPDDVGVARIDAARADLRGRAAALLDLVLSGALGPLTADLATAVADAALRIAPDDSVRLARLAASCLDLGARATAHSLADRSRTAAIELGMGLSSELVRLERQLRAGASPVDWSRGA